MNSSNRPKFGSTVLLLAAVGTLCMAAVQAIMPFSRSLVRAFDGPDEWSTPLLFASSFAVAALLVLVALYPLSGAGRLRRLPLTRLVLAVVGIGLTFRGLPLPGQIAGALGLGPMAGNVVWGDIVSSAGTLALSWCYLLGLAFSWRALGPTRHPRHDMSGRQTRPTSAELR
jgi:hypothetical protein